MKTITRHTNNFITRLSTTRFRRFDILFFLFCLVFSTWLMVHTFSYNGNTHDIRIAYKLWSDFGAHIPLIRSFSRGDNLNLLMHGKPPQYPIFPGEPIRYHFLFYMLVGLLEKIGLRIDWALNVPSVMGFTLLLISLFTLARTLFRSTAVASLSVIFFLFNGSLGFFRFFALHPISFHSISDIIQAKDFPAFAPWGPGEITAFWNLNIFTNQRHLAPAFALVILFMLTCLHKEHARLKQQLRWAIVWGCIFGILPYFHQPTLLIIAIIMATYIIFFPKLRIFLITCGLITTAFVLPQFAFSHTTTSAVEWYPGYTIHNELMAQKDLLKILLHMVWYWWENLGIHSVLIVTGFFLIPNRVKRALMPMIPIFIIPNLFKFSIEASANHKFFNLFLILGGMISAYGTVSIYRGIKKYKNTLLLTVVTCYLGVAMIFLTASGIIDFFVVANDTKGAVSDIPKNEIATWILTSTPKNAVFLNSSYLYHPASIAGRFIFLGWPYFAWSAGYKENRMPIMDSMYESRVSSDFCKKLKHYTISYVTVENVKGDTNLPDIDLPYYLKTYHPVFTSRDKKYAIFTVNDICNTQ